MHLLLALFALAPGRYVGTAPAGRIDLELRADGTAVFGGAPYSWRIDGATLHLGDLALRIDGDCLRGPPFGEVCLRPAPLPPITEPAQAPRPDAWRGAWTHRASGGAVTLTLLPDGRYQMQQPEGVTSGRWRGDARGFTLMPDGGAALRYRARREGEELVVSGGDLPTEVRFRRPDAGRYTPPLPGGDPGRSGLRGVP